MEVSLVEQLVRLIGLVLLALFGVTGTVEPPLSGDAQGFSSTVDSPVVIEDVEVRLLESQPIQVELGVRGYHPDGCDLAVIEEQYREGNTITVKLYRELDVAMMCPMMLVSYEAVIHLEGTFEPGTYTVLVNETEVTFTV